MAERPSRVRDLEMGHQTLSGSLFVLSQRLEDVRDTVVDLSEKVDVIAEKLDAATLASAVAAAEAKADRVEVKRRLDEIETAKANVKKGVAWVAQKGAPILLALAAGSALSEPVKAAIKVALSVP
jgi:hypothetical protein